MKIFLIVLQIVPALIALLKSVEEAMPGEGRGEQKLALVRGILEMSYDKLDEVWPTLKGIIDFVVAQFNTWGVFKKDSADV